MTESNALATFDRAPVIERLPTNVGKRKSTTPQKFVGECFRFIESLFKEKCLYKVLLYLAFLNSIL